MTTSVFLLGTNNIPSDLKQEKSFNCTVIDNPYFLRGCLKENFGEKIVVSYLPFLDIRHFDLYTFLQKTVPKLKVFLVVEELSDSMKTKLKSAKDFVVLWKTEEHNLVPDILTYLQGRKLELRQDRRETHPSKALLQPSSLPQKNQTETFKPVIGASFENISANGSCLKIKLPSYKKKDFINLTYQTKNGEYVTLDGQIRWTKWNEKEKCHELGIQVVAKI